MLTLRGPPTSAGSAPVYARTHAHNPRARVRPPARPPTPCARPPLTLSAWMGSRPSSSVPIMLLPGGGNIGRRCAARHALHAKLRLVRSSRLQAGWAAAAMQATQRNDCIGTVAKSVKTALCAYTPVSLCPTKASAHAHKRVEALWVPILPIPYSSHPHTPRTTPLHSTTHSVLLPLHAGGRQEAGGQSEEALLRQGWGVEHTHGGAGQPAHLSTLRSCPGCCSARVAQG